MKLTLKPLSFQDSNEEMRSSLYQGQVLTAAAASASQRLVQQAESIVNEACGVSALSEVGRDCDNETLFSRLAHARIRLAEDSSVRSLVTELAKSCNFNLSETAIDELRLRCVTLDGHTKTEARAAYYAHRDTWYGNSQSQINWWIPLMDCIEEQTFWFYPEYFTRAVANDSGDFDYSVFREVAGWQARKHATSGKKQQAVYPKALVDIPEKEARSFRLKKGELLLFSGAHLHQTRPNISNSIRMSIDFRTVHQRDHSEGKGAPNVDNASSGSTLEDYFHRPNSEVTA